MTETVINELSEVFTFVLNLLKTIFGLVDSAKTETNDDAVALNTTGNFFSDLWDKVK